MVPIEDTVDVIRLVRKMVVRFAEPNEARWLSRKRTGQTEDLVVSTKGKCEARVEV